MGHELVLSVPKIDEVTVTPNPVKNKSEVRVSMRISEYPVTFRPEDIISGEMICGEEWL